LQAPWVIVVAAVLSSCQAPEKALADLAKYGLERPQLKSAPSDSWRKIKECAAQVEKAMGNDRSENRVSHYSPKYDRCFVRLVDASGFFEKTPSTLLLDAFAGSIGAIAPLTGPCYLAGKAADCAKAEEFIADAMAN